MDHNLIKQCKTGQRHAQLLLYESCFPWLMQVCVRYMPDETEARAILNSGFMKILMNLNRYNPDVPFEAWGKRIMINTIIDAFRKSQSKRRKVEIVEIDFAHESRHVDYNQAELLLDVEVYEKMIHQLPEIQRKVFNLFAIDGYTHAEIGDLLSMSTGTSKWYLNAARQNLKEMIAEKLRSESSPNAASTKRIPLNQPR